MVSEYFPLPLLLLIRVLTITAYCYCCWFFDFTILAVLLIIKVFTITARLDFKYHHDDDDHGDVWCCTGPWSIAPPVKDAASSGAGRQLLAPSSIYFEKMWENVCTHKYRLYALYELYIRLLFGVPRYVRAGFSCTNLRGKKIISSYGKKSFFLSLFQADPCGGMA